MDPEAQLRQLKQQTDQRRRDYESALARAKAVREQYDRDLDELRSRFNLGSAAEARQFIAEKETDITERLQALSEQLAS